MAEIHHLGIYDYVVMTLSLVGSLVIGIRFYFTGGKTTSRDFMLAGKNMSRLPVILSIVVTNLSAILMLGSPAEIYRYGSQLMILILGETMGIVLASYLLLPIYINLGMCTIYQFLEMRYGRMTRIVVSGLFIMQMMLYTPIALYAPALALSAVTDLSSETSILLMGVVCIIYCTLGGLKAVLWTDSFQSGLMFVSLLIVTIGGIMEVGGISEVVHRSKEGGRWEFFNFTLDLTTRYTVWNAFFRGLSLGIGSYGVSQMEVQRLLSMNIIKDAQSALLWSIPPTMIIIFMCYCMGLILYGVFYLCDPVLNGVETGLTKHDQLVPYYIVTRLSKIPGLTGFIIAGLFSASLSTLSSAINSVSTVTVVDFIQPSFSCVNDKDKLIVWIAKGLVTFYGLLCIGLTFLFSRIGSLTQMSSISVGMMEGPVIAIFLLGVLTVRTNQKGSAIGFLAGCLISGWLGYGSVISGYIYPALPLSVENCPNKLNITQIQSKTIQLIENDTSIANTTQEQLGYDYSNSFLLYRISYMWIPTIGFICTVCVSYVTSVLISWNEKKKIDANFLSPVFRKWMRNATFESEKKVNIEMRNTSDTTIETIK